MAVQGSGFFTRSSMPMREVHFRQTTSAGRQQTSFRFGLVNRKSDGSGALQPLRVLALNLNDADSGKKSPSSPVPNSNYVVPLDKSTCIIRPLGEILRDLNKRILDNIIVKPDYHSDDGHSTFIPWYHANRMLSFYAPGWCGEIRDVIFSDNGNVMVVYRVTIRGLDGEAHRESTGTVSSHNVDIADPVAAAEEIAFCRACARFGLGLYLYNKE